jgi:hypothetical protein
MKTKSYGFLLLLASCGTYVRHSHKDQGPPFQAVKAPGVQHFCGNQLHYQSSNSLGLGWAPSSMVGVAGFAIYEGNLHKNYSARHDLGMTQNYYTDLLAGKNYNFSIRTYNSANVETELNGELNCFDVKMISMSCSVVQSDTQIDVTYLRPTAAGFEPEFRYNLSFNGSIFNNPDDWVDTSKQIISSQDQQDGTTRDTIRLVIPGGMPTHTYLVRMNACTNLGT